MAGPIAAFAAVMNRPFAVGSDEAGGAATGVTGWLLNAQSYLTHLMSAHLRALSGDPNAIWALMALGFAYGVFHAAGPGHGKAVVASYMLANDRALKRGLILAALAALLQGSVAVALVSIAALVFRATATTMNTVAFDLAYVSYAGIALMGAWLVWKKGRALTAALARRRFDRAAVASATMITGASWKEKTPTLSDPRFRVVSPDGAFVGDPECAHDHAPDPRLLGAEFSWRSAFGTVLAAGARPCSGAILILVFSLAQNLFYAGVAATFAMSLGTALTTGALAVLAVFAKDLAIRFAADTGDRAELAARSIEFAAAILVLFVGVGLLVEAGSVA